MSPKHWKQQRRNIQLVLGCWHCLFSSYAALPCSRSFRASRWPKVKMEWSSRPIPNNPKYSNDIEGKSPGIIIYHLHPAKCLATSSDDLAVNGLLSKENGTPDRVSHWWISNWNDLSSGGQFVQHLSPLPYFKMLAIFSNELFDKFPNCTLAEHFISDALCQDWKIL